MSNPLQNRSEQRRSTADKILSVVDVIWLIAGALLRVFGRRKGEAE